MSLWRPADAVRETTMALRVDERFRLAIIRTRIQLGALSEWPEHEIDLDRCAFARWLVVNGRLTDE